MLEVRRHKRPRVAAPMPPSMPIPPPVPPAGFFAGYPDGGSKVQEAFGAFYAQAKPALERILAEHPELVGEPYASGIRPLWLLQPMLPLIDGDPSTWCEGCEPAILLGNYPKPNASVTHSDGLRGMLDKDARGGGFANDSIHALAGTLAASKAGSPATELGRAKADVAG